MNYESQVCTICNIEKPLSEFYSRKDSQNLSYRKNCKQCCRDLINGKRKAIIIPAAATLETKICKTCRIEKKVSEFNWARKGKFYQPYCKPCDKERKQTHRYKNICSYQAKSKEHYLVNRDEILNKEKEKRRGVSERKQIEKLKWQQDHQEEIALKMIRIKEKKREYQRKYRLEGRYKDRYNPKEYGKIYRENNTEYIRHKKAEYQKKRRHKDATFKAIESLKSRMRISVIKGYKSAKSKELLGCDYDHLKKHIESQFIEGMTWENHGTHGWHIDHIIPLSVFDLSNHEDQRKAFHYTNLRPLWWQDNIAKWKHLDYELPEKYINKTA